MTCPECNKEAQAEWLFCPFCQNPLKEKCPECGEMEQIGRAVCEKEVRKINIEKQQYIEKKVPDFFTRILLPGSALGTILYLGAIISGFIWGYDGALTVTFWVGIGILVMSVPVWRVADITVAPRLEKRAEKEFFRLHPDYAEILKKAEGEK